MQAFIGVIFHFIGGFAAGSFYMPYKKIREWSWESYWMAGGIFSWLIAPPLAACLTIPGFPDIISHTSLTVLGATYLMGALWGVGGLTYGLGIRYLGMSLGNSIVLGFCSAFGALVPPLYRNFYPAEGSTSFSQLLAGDGGRLVLLGVVICLAGIFLCGRAGMLKENELDNEKKKKSISEFNLTKGLTVAIISGILSACFAFGIDTGKPMANIANAIWMDANPGQGNFLFQNNVTYVVLLWGGLSSNFIWCLILSIRNKSFRDYTNSKSPLLKNYALAALAGTTWFLQFFFYGMGESKMGNGAGSWILHMSFIILIANIWGLLLKEWKSVSRRILTTFITGIAIIILSILLVGYGNYLS